MKLKIYSVYDSKAQAYLQPFYMPSRGAALRAWGDAVNDNNGQFKKHAGDYSLFELGEFNDENGTFEIDIQRTNLGNGVEFLERKEPQDIQAAQQIINRKKG